MVWAYAENPRILVLDFESLHHQGEALNRIAALFEKQGAPRGRVMSMQELNDFVKSRNENFNTFYFGHNYSATKLARFFNLAEKQNLPLTSSERMVRDLAVKHGLLVKVSDRWSRHKPEKALVSIVQPTKDKDVTVDARLRATILRHEISHGQFATKPRYREFCIKYWREALVDSDRDAFRRFMSKRGYDINIEMIAIDEAQAFLMHTPDERAFSAKLLGLSRERVMALQEAFRQGLRANNIHIGPSTEKL